jgi:DNA mismatch endonuclease (patch repair protein)
MKGNRRRDTKPELALRSMLHAHGYRFRVDHAVPLSARRPTRVDIAFTKVKLAVFVDGCFWHGCPEHGTVPRSNEAYWVGKLARNAERDVEVDRALVDADWTVIHVWEHERPKSAAARIGKAIDAARSPVV